MKTKNTILAAIFIIATLTTFAVPPPCNLSINNVSVTNVSCYPMGDGSIIFDAPCSNCIGAREYSIDGGASWHSSSEFTGLSTGAYYPRVRDSGNPTGCFESWPDVYIGNSYGTITRYLDYDNDGYGLITMWTCVGDNYPYPFNPTFISGDCDDYDPLVYPGVGCPGSPSLSVYAGPDASSYFGYIYGQDVTNTAQISGGTGPYQYTLTIDRNLFCNTVNDNGDEIISVSGGSCTTCPPTGAASTVTATCSGTTSSTAIPITVRLMFATTVTITVTDLSDMSTATDYFIVDAMDARCTNPNKVRICHFRSNPSPGHWDEMCVGDDKVATHLAHGDYIGPCTPRLDFSDGESSYDVQVYPNPASHTVSFNTNGYVGKLQLQVVNMLGQKIISEEVSLNGEATHTIDVSNLPSGIYKLILLNDSELNEGSFVKE